MSRAARSLFAFGIYVIVAGVSFLAAPTAMSSLLRLPAATDGWARMVGLLALVIGAYDMIAARAECLPYVRSSIFVRLGFVAGTVLLVVLQQMPPTLLLLGAADFAGAVWTALELRSPDQATVAV